MRRMNASVDADFREHTGFVTHQLATKGVWAEAAEMASFRLPAEGLAGGSVHVLVVDEDDGPLDSWRSTRYNRLQAPPLFGYLSSISVASFPFGGLGGFSLLCRAPRAASRLAGAARPKNCDRQGRVACTCVSRAAPAHRRSRPAPARARSRARRRRRRRRASRRRCGRSRGRAWPAAASAGDDLAHARQQLVGGVRQLAAEDDHGGVERSPRARPARRRRRGPPGAQSRHGGRLRAGGPSRRARLWPGSRAP